MGNLHLMSNFWLNEWMNVEEDQYCGSEGVIDMPWGEAKKGRKVSSFLPGPGGSTFYYDCKCLMALLILISNWFFILNQLDIVL
jgi:hypothetical protein